MTGNSIAEKVSPPKFQRKRLKFRRETGTVICIILMIVFCAAALMLFQNAISDGAESLADEYHASYASEKDATEQAFFQQYYNSAEAETHVSNRGSIYIGNIRDVQKLEVLKVSDVEFIVEDSGGNSGNITSWLEVPGEGTFVVDLSAAEFIVDNARAHVRVRLPYPELTNVVIDYSNVRKILFKDDVFNGSYKQGEELAMKQLGEADLLIKKEFASNQHFYMNAQEAAVSTITCLIRQLNPDVDNLTIEVEFY